MGEMRRKASWVRRFRQLTCDHQAAGFDPKPHYPFLALRQLVVRRHPKEDLPHPIAAADCAMCSDAIAAVRPAWYRPRNGTATR
jgi:hypothetical protein